MHEAAAKGHLNILQLLIDVYGVDPTATTKVYLWLLSMCAKFVLVVNAASYILQL